MGVEPEAYRGRPARALSTPFRTTPPPTGPSDATVPVAKTLNFLSFFCGAPRGIAIPTRSRSAAMRNYFTILL